MRSAALWSNTHRGVLIALLAILCVYLTIRLLRNPVYVSDPQPPEPARAHEVEDRIDPNMADAHTLAALPLIGEKRGEDIIAYREKYVAEHPGQPAFLVREDLMHVRGIGTATIAEIGPYLQFPTTRTVSTSQRSGSDRP